MTLIKLSVATAFFLVISACGGGGGSSDSGGHSDVKTGVFLDSPVSGLAYVTETQSGVTNGVGEFNYVAGESVSFSLDGLELGTADAMETVPVTALPNGLTVALILQSLDTDPAEGSIDVGDIRLMDSSRQVLSAIISGDQDDSALDVSLMNDVKQSTSEAGGTQPYLDAPLSRTAVAEHIRQQLAVGISFSNAWLDNRMMVTTNTLLGGSSQSKYAMRFDQDAQLRFVGFNDDGNQFNYDKLDRTITAGGALSVVFSDGRTCLWEIVGETEFTVETFVSCDGDDPRARSFYISKPMTAADLDGKSYTITSENGDAPYVASFNDGELAGEDRVFGDYQTSRFQGVYANFTSSADIWFLLKGDTDSGLLMNWGFTLPEDTVETMSFVKLKDSNSWHGFNWSYPY